MKSSKDRDSELSSNTERNNQKGAVQSNVSKQESISSESGVIEVVKVTHVSVPQPKPPRIHSGKHTFRIDPNLISGTQTTPNVSCNITQNDKQKDGLPTDPVIDENKKDSNMKPVSSEGPKFNKTILENKKPLPPKRSDSQATPNSPKLCGDVLIRQNSINSSIRGMQKAMRSFDNPVVPSDLIKNPNLDKFGEKFFVDNSGNSRSSPKDSMQKYDEPEKLKQSVVHKKLNYSASFTVQPKCNPNVNEPINTDKIKEIPPDVRMTRSEGPVGDEDNSVSNVIKRFNDKCETLSRNKQIKTEIISEQADRHFNSKPFYATMDCRTKRNNLMTRGHTVTEYSVKTDYFKRQTSIGSSFSMESDKKNYVKGSNDHGGSHCVHCVKPDSKSHGHCKIRSKSQSSADEEVLKRSGYDYSTFEDRYRGNVANQRVRFDEPFSRPGEGQKMPFSGHRGRNRPTSAGNSDCERDDDLFEKYETLV